MSSGVLQGSGLGPLLFILYVNDIVEFIQSELEIFADDTKIYSVIETIHDIAKLQHMEYARLVCIMALEFEF